MDEPMGFKFKKDPKIRKNFNMLNPQISFPNEGDEIIPIEGMGFLSGKDDELITIQLDPNNPINVDIVLIFQRGEDLVEMIETWLMGVKERIKKDAN